MLVYTSIPISGHWNWTLVQHALFRSYRRSDGHYDIQESYCIMDQGYDETAPPPAHVILHGLADLVSSRVFVFSIVSHHCELLGVVKCLLGVTELTGCMRVYVCMYSEDVSSIHIRTCWKYVCICTHTHTHTRTSTHTHTYTQAHTHTHKHTHTHTYTQAHTHTHKHTHTFMHANNNHALMYTDMYTYLIFALST